MTYCKVKSSEEKFANHVFNVFKGYSETMKPCVTEEMIENNIEIKTKKDLLIAWGNWGRNPNLKGSSPTPGIGIRRSFERYYKTETVNEYLTSQTCPCCKGEKCLHKERSHKGYEIHHLLRCTNDSCESRLWNRNVVGSYNILSKALSRTRLMNPSESALRC